MSVETRLRILASLYETHARELAALSNVSPPTIAGIELEDGPVVRKHYSAKHVIGSLERAGVRFVRGGVVRS
jgi:hypothetical protein